LAIEEPVRSGYSPAFHFHPALTGMLRPTLIGDQVVQVREPRETRLLASAWVVQPLHREQFPLDGMMGLIQQGTGHRHPRICEHRRPARFLLLNPAPHARAMGRSSRGGDVIGNVAQPLAQRTYAQAVALAGSVQQGVRNCERNAWRTEDAMAASFPGSLLIAWRRQLPRRAPGHRGRRLLVVLSKPSVRIPWTRDEGSCWTAAC
jgi:hypothetical protein